MSSTSEYIKQNGLDVVIDPTATNDTLPTMPSTGDGGSGNSTDLVLGEFVKILFQSNKCFREYCEKTKRLTLVFYNKTHTGCKVIIYLKSSTITIKLFLHGDTLKETEHTFHSSGFQKYVTPFLTPAELEQQKKFDDFQVEQQRLMAEQQKLQKQEEKSRKEALEKAHISKPQTCGGVDKCTICKFNEQHRSVCMWTSRFPIITGT